MALLHFGTNESCDNTNLLRDEFLAKISTHKAAIWAATKSRFVFFDLPIKHEIIVDTFHFRGLNFPSTGSEDGESAANETSNSNRKQQSAGSGSFITSSAMSNTGTKLPKWFKPTGK